MENLKYNLFDFFAFLLPGSVLSLCLTVHIFHINLCDNFGQVFKDAISIQNPLLISVIFIVVSYLLGFISSIVVSIILNFKKYWDFFAKKQTKINTKAKATNKEESGAEQLVVLPPRAENIEPSLSDSKPWISYKTGKYVLIREHSKENFQYIERWNTLKNMTQNLSFVILVATIFSIINLWTCCLSKSTILVYGSISIISIISLFIKSREYADWAKYELSSAVSMILEDRGNKELGKTENTTIKS